MSDSIKGFWAESAFAYSSHCFFDGTSLCGAHSYHPFFSHSSPSCDKRLCKKCLKSLDKIQSKESEYAKEN